MDTPEHEIEALRRMSPTRKVAVMTTLIRQAYDLVEAGVRVGSEGLTDEEVRLRVRDRIAGDRS